MGLKAVIISFISGNWIDKKFSSIRGRYGSVPAIYPSIPCNADTSITEEIVDIGPDMLIHPFDPRTDSCADRSDLRENMFIQRER